MIEQLRPENRDELITLMHEFYHPPAVLSPVPDAHFERTCDVLWLEELYIRPEFQGQGLGSHYFAWLQEAYGDKVARMRLEVEPENERARALYARMGFSDLPYLQMHKDAE